MIVYVKLRYSVYRRDQTDCHNAHHHTYSCVTALFLEAVQAFFCYFRNVFLVRKWHIIVEFEIAMAEAAEQLESEEGSVGKRGRRTERDEARQHRPAPNQPQRFIIFPDQPQLNFDFTNVRQFNSIFIF